MLVALGVLLGGLRTTRFIEITHSHPPSENIADEFFPFESETGHPKEKSGKSDPNEHTHRIPVSIEAPGVPGGFMPSALFTPWPASVAFAGGDETGPHRPADEQMRPPRRA